MITKNKTIKKTIHSTKDTSHNKKTSPRVAREEKGRAEQVLTEGTEGSFISRGRGGGISNSLTKKELGGRSIEWDAGNGTRNNGSRGKRVNP